MKLQLMELVQRIAPTARTGSITFTATGLYHPREKQIKFSIKKKLGLQYCIEAELNSAKGPETKSRQET